MSLIDASIKHIIIEQVENCKDEGLLDLIYKLLLTSQSGQ